MSETKNFHVGDIISITSGVLVSPSHIGGVYAILNWLTGDNLMTHQLPRASREAEPFLKGLFPDLAGISIPHFMSEAEVLAWIGDVAKKHGETRDVPKLPPVDHTKINPIAELKMMRPDAQIIGVQAEL